MECPRSSEQLDEDCLERRSPSWLQLAALRAATPASAAWVAECERRLDEFAMPHAGLQLAAVDLIRDLVRSTSIAGG